jgi:hypothetical protein
MPRAERNNNAPRKNKTAGQNAQPLPFASFQMTPHFKHTILLTRPL